MRSQRAGSKNTQQLLAAVGVVGSMSSAKPLRILCLEDNPLIAFHIEQMIEDLGHLPALTLSSFAQLEAIPQLAIDCALIDIDLADGRTGPAAARWLHDRGIPGFFVTGQKDVADANAAFVKGCVIKPVSTERLASALSKLALL
jgi:CheY-like chemotaxis protein